MDSQGTWTFDSRDYVPHACDMKLSLAIEPGDSTTTIPITIKYSRISPAQFAEMAAKAKQQAAEAKKMAADKKAIAETLLTNPEKPQAVAALTSRVAGTQIETLDQLAAKSLTNNNPQISNVIELLLKHPDKK